MKLGRVAIGSVALVCAATAYPVVLPNWLKYLNKEVWQRVQITGYRRLAYHNHFVAGDQEAFNTLNYSGMGNQRFTDIGEIGLVGKRVFGLFNFDARILDSRFTDPQGQRFSLEYDRGGVQVALGDIQGSLLNTNRFAGLSKSLKGVSAGYRRGRLQTKAIFSEAKGSARTVTISGNNSSGPFYLQNSQIVQGSEQVQVDGVSQELGRDYVINYEVGSITFTHSVISVTSTIVVTYEAYGFNERRGKISGAALSYDFGRAGRMGLTVVRQIAGTGGALSTRLEKFQGFGAPSTPYFLQFEPLSIVAVILRVDGVVQTLNVDYRFDVDNSAVFYMNRFVPATSTIDVVYTPKPRGTADGDRQNVGLDYTIPLAYRGGKGALSLYQSLGRLTNSATPTSGTARGASLSYAGERYRFLANLRSVPQTFVSVESRGFNRNEKAYDMTFEGKPSEELSYTLSQLNSAITSRTILTSGATSFINSRFSSLKGEAAYRPTKDMSWDVSQVRTKSRSLGGETQLDASELSTTHNLGRLTTKLGLERQSGWGPSSAAANATRQSVSLIGAKLGATYDAGNRFSLRGETSIMDVKSAGKHGTGRDYELNAVYTPMKNLHVSSRYALSDSGALVTLGGFQNGFGLGYNGNGFTGGSGTNSLTGATDLRLLSFVGDYQPTDRLSFNVNLTKARYSGSVSSNTETTSSGISSSYTITPGTVLSASVDRSKTTYIDSPLSSSSSSLSFFLDGQAGKRWGYQLGASIFLSGGNSTFKQDSALYNGAVTYRLADRHMLIFDFTTGRTSGYLPQHGTDLGLTYQYRIWSNLALNGSYRRRNVRNLDPLVSTGAYRSGGFDIELSFSFGGR